MYIFFLRLAASLVRVGLTRFADGILKHSLWQGGFGHPIQTWYHITASLTTHITIQYENMDYYHATTPILRDCLQLVFQIQQIFQVALIWWTEGSTNYYIHRACFFCQVKRVETESLPGRKAYSYNRPGIRD